MKPRTTLDLFKLWSHRQVCISIVVHIFVKLYPNGAFLGEAALSALYFELQSHVTFSLAKTADP